MRCQNKGCMNLSRTPTKVESYRRFSMCRVCCIKLGLIQRVKHESHIAHARKPKGLRWRQDQGYAYKQHSKKIPYFLGIPMPNG